MNPNRIFAKASGDCRGRGSFNITRPTRIEKMHAADLVIYLRRKIPCRVNDNLILEVGKDRNGNHGVKTLPEAIEAIAGMLCRYKFQDENHMFQTSLRIRLEEAMKEVLIGDDVVPTSKAIKEYAEGGIK